MGRAPRAVAQGNKLTFTYLFAGGDLALPSVPPASWGDPHSTVGGLEMFAMRETWQVVLDGKTHRIEAVYIPATGELRLLHDGQLEKEWPGGFVDGARLGAAHGFDIGPHQVEFSAGLSKFNRHFLLEVDRRRVEPELQSLNPANLVMGALMTIGGIIMLGIMLGGWGKG